jgi:hypothetical protein
MRSASQGSGSKLRCTRASGHCPGLTGPLPTLPAARRSGTFGPMVDEALQQAEEDGAASPAGDGTFAAALVHLLQVRGRRLAGAWLCCMRSCDPTAWRLASPMPTARLLQLLLRMLLQMLMLMLMLRGPLLQALLEGSAPREQELRRFGVAGAHEYEQRLRLLQLQVGRCRRCCRRLPLLGRSCLQQHGGCCSCCALPSHGPYNPPARR